MFFVICSMVLNMSRGFVECSCVSLCLAVGVFQNECENCVEVDARVKSHFSYLFMKWGIVRKASCLQLINYGSTIITSCWNVSTALRAENLIETVLRKRTNIIDLIQRWHVTLGFSYINELEKLRSQLCHGIIVGSNQIDDLLSLFTYCYIAYGSNLAQTRIERRKRSPTPFEHISSQNNIHEASFQRVSKSEHISWGVFPSKFSIFSIF